MTAARRHQCPGAVSFCPLVVVVVGARHRCRRWSVDGDRIVLRHVDDLRARRRDRDDLVAILRLGRDLQLLRTLQVADVPGLRAQPLHRIHHALLVVDERLPEFGSPPHLRAHHVHDFRGLQQAADRRREAHLLRGFVERIALQGLVLQQPVAGVQHFLGIRGRDQHLAEHDIGVQRHRGKEFLHRLGGPRRCRRSERLGCRRCIDRCSPALRCVRGTGGAAAGVAGSLSPQPAMATSIAIMVASVALRSALVPIIVLFMYSSPPLLLSDPASGSVFDCHDSRLRIGQAVAYLAGAGCEALFNGCYDLRTADA